VRIGLLGASRIAPPAVVEPATVRGGAVLQAVAARDPQRARAFAERHGILRVEEDYAALIAAPDIDLIYNALPINLHAVWSERALAAGKHVLCEKPFALTLDEARRVVEVAAASDRRVIEAFHYRYHPAFQTLLDWIARGAIGKVMNLEAVFSVPIPDRDGAEIRHRPETGGGAFMDLGCYPLNWALTVLDADPLAVNAQATLTPRGVDESMTATLEFAGGVRARLSCSMARDAHFAARLIVTGEEGVIDFLNPLAPHRGARLTLKAGEREETALVNRLSTYTYQLDAVLSALEAGKALPTEGDAILRQQRALDSVYQAARLRGPR
jgi:predicted dehydrogenase